MSNNEGMVEVPIVQDEFANFLRKYKVAKGGELCDTIAENIAETGGANVFEDPEILATGLAKWSEYIGAPLRKQLLEHWLAKKHIDVTPEALETVGVTAKTEAAIKKKKDREKKETEGALWTVDVDDSGMPRIRMIKDETEPGTTLEQAKAAAAEIGKEREQPIVVFNEELGRHMPNFQSAFVKQNPTAAWATARQMDKAMAEGEPGDPMDIWLDQQVKLTQMKELMGISPETKEKGTVGEIIDGVKQLQEMAKEGKVSGLPEWMSNPVDFIRTVQEFTGAGESKVDDTLRAEVTELRRTIDSMREDTHRQEIARLNEQIVAQGAVHQKQMQEVVAKIDEMGRAGSGRTEMDILHEIATEGIGVIKTEAAGMRGVLKEVVSGAGLPSAKTPEEREERKGRYRKSIQDDREIEEIGQRLFFSQS